MHQLNMCCGTTCDKETNLGYVKRLEDDNDSLRVEVQFYKDLYYEAIGDIQKHYINLGKEKKK